MNGFYDRLKSKSLKCDVLIVGCGPGGSGAAYKAASKGLDTVVIEKKKRIGSPVRCGEVMDPSLLEKFDIEIDPSIIEEEQEGTVFWINENIRAENLSPLWKSITLDRNRLDKYLAQKATRKGANIIADSKLKEIEFEDGGEVKSALVETSTKDIKIKPEVIIAADGTCSTVASLQGIERPEKSEIGVTVSYEMTNVNLLEYNKVQMFFDEFTFGGYGYIIPKTKHTANIGLGILGREDEPWKDFKRFLHKNQIVKKQIKDAGILEVKVGRTPITGPNLPTVRENVLYVGDAAGQNLAHVGEGTFPSHICGRIAGKVTSEAIKREDLDLLSKYDKELNRTIGPLLKECGDIRDKIFEIYDQDLDRTDKSFLIGLIAGEILPKNYDNLKELCNLEEDERIEKVNSLLNQDERKDHINISEINL